MKTNVILIFDIGKTNKKALLFDENLTIRQEESVQFSEIHDDDGFPSEDIESVERWIDSIVLKILNHNAFNLDAINLATYGATLVYLDNNNKRVAPVYNYLKPMPEGITESLYENYGGISEFCRKTASPALGMLNSGLQILWLKKFKPQTFNKAKSILHFPQYLSFRYTGKTLTEHTSIGCHTAMWDFDLMQYHQWLKNERIHLPDPVSTGMIVDGFFNGKKLKIGTGIHDSSASLVPYLKDSASEFILLSTGTWCINMNPFNNTPLTAKQLENDCLCYLSTNQHPVKSSRVFTGNIHDLNVELFSAKFNVSKEYFRTVKPDDKLINKYLFKNYNLPFLSENKDNQLFEQSEFKNYEEAYHALMSELIKMIVKSINFILSEEHSIPRLYVTGGFAKNKLFTRMLASYFKNKDVYTTDIDNATSLGAAVAIWEQSGLKSAPLINLNFSKVEPVKSSE